MGIKRLVDLTVAVVLLVATLPLQLATAFAILATMGRPVFFLQQRPGLHGRPFTLIKFRTMRPARDGDAFGVERITPLGRWLRRFSLDELPELINVLKGDMSLVGPRPLLHEYMPLFNEYQAQRHNVKPGMTGLAQIRGRNRISWSRRLRYDVWYVRHQSLWLDMMIMSKTVLAVLRTEDVNQSESVTMKPFRGGM